jgi:Cys-tRNA(Pro) deacylase
MTRPAVLTRKRGCAMGKEKGPVTPAVRTLRENRVEFTEHIYKYVERGGTAEGARQLGLDEHSLVKTLIMEDELKRPIIVLMHGDHEVSTKELARILDVKRVAPCSPETAQKHSGYMVGGTSPFATRKEMPVYIEETILDLPRIYINGGKRGYLLGIDPRELSRVLRPLPVKAAVR